MSVTYSVLLCSEDRVTGNVANRELDDCRLMGFVRSFTVVSSPFLSGSLWFLAVMYPILQLLDQLLELMAGSVPY